MKIQSAKAGIGTGRAGLQAASGLFSSAGLFNKGVKSFNPLDLDPYLLFDAQTSMIGTLENPTLDLDPSKQDTLDVITATRAGTTATFRDSAGLIQVASPNSTRVDYTQGAELTPTKFQRVKYTDFSQLWSGGNATLTDGQGFSGNNSKIIAGTSTSGFIDTSVATEDGVTYTGSIYIRRLSGTGGLEFTAYSSASSDVTPVITDTIGTDFVRVSFQFLGKSGGGNVFFGIKIQQSGDSVEIAMPQVEEGTTASSFVANTTGSPKFITGATFGPRVPMILVEPSATNLVTYSEDFSQGNWNKNRVTVVDNSITSPDGSLNAVKLVETASTATHLTWTQATTTAAAHSFSVFAKAGERKRIGLRDNQIGNSAVFDLQSGSVISGSGGSIAQAANGFFRITLTGTYAAAGTRHEIYVLPDNATTANASYTGDGTSGVYIWGAQVEAGSVATSLIPTSGGDAAARTRASDELVISGSDFSDFYNGSAGTFFIQAQNRTPELNGAVLMGQNSNKLFFYKSNPNRLSTYDGGSFTHHDGLVANQLFNAAVTFNTSNRSSSLDGSALDTDTINTQWAGADILKIGFGYSNNFNGHYRRILFWPYHSDSL